MLGGNTFENRAGGEQMYFQKREIYTEQNGK